MLILNLQPQRTRAADRLQDIALLVNPTNPNSEMQSKNTKEAAHRIGLELHVLNASVERDFNTAFARLRELKAGALIIPQDVYFNAESSRLAALAIRHAIRQPE